MGNKIYCKNCKYFVDDYCDARDVHPLFTTSEINHKGLKIYRWKNKPLYYKLFNTSNTYTKNSQCTPNKNFKCPLYKCKWYKFWVIPKKGPAHLIIELLK